MFEISKLMNHLIKYGHSKIFIPTNDNPNENYVIYFYLNTEGHLIVEEGTWTFNKPYWDGYNIDEKAYVINRCMTTLHVRYADLVSFITIAILGSLYDYGIYQTADEVYDLNDLNDKTLKVIYNFIMAAIDIPNYILYKMIFNDQSERIDEVVTSGLTKYKTIPFSKDLAPKLIDRKMTDTLNRYYSIKAIVKASEECLPPHTKTLLNDAINRIANDISSDKVDTKIIINKRF